MRHLRNTTALVFLCCCLCAQLPDTDIWLFKITAKPEPALGKGRNLTLRPGYDNQPAFSADAKKFYYVSVRDDMQADTFLCSIKKGKPRQITKSGISEYSPMPANDGKLLTAVTVEADSAQYIHYIQTGTGIHEKRVEVDSVGYYTFLNADTLVYYKLTEPHTLRYHVIPTGEDRWLADSPCRAIRVLNRHTVVYALKDSSVTTFYRYDFHLQRAEQLCSYPSLNEDFILHPLYGLVKTEGLQLLRYNGAQREWQLLFDLSGRGLHKITRFDIDVRGRYLLAVDQL